MSSEPSVAEVVRLALYLTERVAMAIPSKGKVAPPTEQVAAYRAAEERLERFLEAVDPGNGRRAWKAECEAAEALARRFGF